MSVNSENIELEKRWGYLRTFFLFLIPLLLLCGTILYFAPLFFENAIARSYADIFAAEARIFFAEGRLSPFLRESGKTNETKKPRFAEEFDLLGIYEWDGHWINLYSNNNAPELVIDYNMLSREFVRKNNTYFWKGNNKAALDDKPVFYAAESRGGTLYLLTARLKPDYIGVLEYPSDKPGLYGWGILGLVSLIIAFLATLVANTFYQSYVLKVKRAIASAEYIVPPAPCASLHDIGEIAIETAEAAHQIRHSKRKAILQTQSKLANERQDFAIVREIAKSAVSAPNLKQAASEALVPIIRRTGFRCGAIFSADDGGNLRLVGETNLPADLADVLSEFDPEVDNLKAPANGIRGLQKIKISEIPSAESNPIISLQEEGLTHAVVIPLEVKGKLWGVLHLYSPGPPRLDERDEALILTASDEIALILENKSLVSHLDELIKEELAYYEFSKFLISSNDFDMLLENVLWLIHETIGTPYCSVLLGDDDEEMLYVKAMWGYGREHQNMKIPYGKGITGWVMENGQAILAKNVETEPRYMKGFDWVTSELAVPLIADGKIIGVLDCESNDEHRLLEKDLRFLSSISAPVALAIKRSLAFTEISRQLVLDPLTNLYNRRYFDRFIEDNGEEILLRHGKVSVAFISISNLSDINDAYGYVAGDLIVKQVGKMLSELFPEGKISRYGGDEFLVLLPGIGEEAMERMVEELLRLRKIWERDHPDSLPLVFSQGYATTNRYDELQGLIHTADSQAAHKRRTNGEM